MPKKRKIKLIPLLSFLLFSLTFSSNAAASDLDILNVVTEDVTPNVLLIIDISGSMAYNDVWDANDNRYYTRLAIAKKVVEEVIRENPNVKWGLFTFPNQSGTTQSGQLIAPCMTRNTAQLNSFINQIKSLSATGGTPVASALAEAGLYFAGQQSFFWSTKYTSPIDNECQYNNIILMTDGFSSVDSGVKGGYTTSSADKYNMYVKNSIFLRSYLNGQIIGDYITRKTNSTDPNERIDLGSKLNRPEFIKSTLWTAATNDEINGNLSVYNTYYSSISWAKVESGSPTLGHTNLQKNGQLYLSKANELIINKTPYISGYNANDPSRPFPTLTFYANGSNTLLDLSEQGYLQDTQIYQGNHTGAGLFASDYLDDVAAFLNNEDLMPNLGVGTKYEKQTVKTYVVGFMFSSDLLERTSIMGGTGPKDEGYFTAEDYEELKMAFSSIVRSMKEEMSAFAAPAVPSSGENEAYSGDYLYMGLFKPQEGFWIGNVKRYTLDENHTMDSYQENDVIKSTAKSDWSSKVDGKDIAKGGVVESLTPVLSSMVNVSNTENLRRIYTYIAGNSELQLKHSSNLFIESNSVLRANSGTLLGFENGTADATVKAAITRIRLTPMGAVMHSTPTVVHYPTQKVVFVGANDGFLHAFLDNDNAAPEAWAFVLPDHLATITNARDTNPSDGVYYVDGSIVTSTVGSKKVLITGTRRGGETYVALDITSYTDPKFLFQIPSLETSESALWSDIPLGQSWGTSRFVNVLDNGIILIPGGYDPRYDTLAPEDIPNPKGAVIVGVNAINGKPDSKFKQLNGKESNIMKHSILDLLPLDMNADNLVDTIYYGDLGGNMFYAWPYSQSTSGSVYTYTAQEEFVPYIMFKTAADSGRKFMFAPDVLKKDDIEYVFFGSGDRETPLTKNVQDRFYCVHNKDKNRLAATSSVGNYLTEADLADVTENLIQSSDDTERTIAQDKLDAASGWYLDLLKGEKVVGTPIAYRTYVIFTTYQPLYEELPDPTDVCVGGSSTGLARLYVLNYLTGGAALDENGDGKLDSDDRSTIIGNTIPSAPVLGVFEDGSAVIYVTVGKINDNGDNELSIPSKPLPSENPVAAGSPEVFYWREIF